MLVLRSAVVALAFAFVSEVAAQVLIPPPRVPSREIDLTAPIDPRPASPAWHRAEGRADGACVLTLAGERVVAIPVALDGTPGASTRVPLPPGSQRSHGFTSVLAPTGRLHVAMGIDLPSGGRGLATAYSDDLGSTWSAPTRLNAPDTPVGSRFQSSYRQVAIDADGTGRVAVAWVAYTSAAVHFSSSADGGATWTPPVRAIDDAPGTTPFGNQGLDVAFDAGSGSIVVASADYTATYWGGAVVRTSRSTDGGATFSPPELLPGTPDPATFPDVVYPDLGVLPDGSIGLVFTEYSDGSGQAAIAFARSTDGGASWSRGPSHPLPNDAFTYGDVDPSLVSSGGSSLLVWPASAGLTVARWDVAGAAFVEPQLLTGRIFRPMWIQGVVGIARTEAGTWAIAWLPGTSSGQSVLHRTSSDGGRTWSEATELVVDPSANPAGRPRLAGLGGDRLLGVQFGTTIGGDGRVVVPRTAVADPAAAGFGDWRLADPAAPDVGSALVDGPRLVSTTGPNVAAVFSANDRDSNNVWARASADRGVTFGAPVRLSAFAFPLLLRSGTLQVAATEDGWVWAAYVSVTSGVSGFEVRVNVSRDHGATWLPGDVVAGRSTSNLADNLRLAAASGGRAWLAWTSGNALQLTRTLDGGGTFTTIDGDQSTVNASGFPRLCVSGSRVFLAWRGRMASTFPTQSLVSFSDDGVAFSPPRATTWLGGANAAMTCLTDGSVLLAWPRSGYPAPHTDQLAVQRFDGTTLEPVVDTGVPAQSSGSLTFDAHRSGGGALVVLSRAVPSGTVLDERLFVARSTDGGATWSVPTRLDDVSPAPGGFDRSVALASDRSGKVWASWVDDPGIDGYAILSRRSDDAGVTWTPPVRLDADPSPWSRRPGSAPATVTTVDGALLVGIQRLRAGNSDSQGVLNADDVLDRDRDGSPAGEDCDDANPDLFPGQCGNAPPLADAGPDQILECTGELSATATLDGSASSDPDGEEDLASWIWSEHGTTIAEGEVADASFALGSHDVLLTVTDRSGETGDDDLRVTVVDTAAPAGSIVSPAPGFCTNQPVTVEASFADVCDPSLDLDFAPGPGPVYWDHGDGSVTVTATDAAGNAGSASVSFTIDTVPPEVAWLVEPGASIALPATVPMALLFASSDEDQASGGVVHERMLLDGCPIFDGTTYGDGDGLLSDETLVLDLGTLCRVATECGRTSLQAPTLVVEATDCGGNVGASGLSLSGSVALRPGVCGKGGATSLRPAGGPGLAPTTGTTSTPRNRIRKAKEGRR